MSDDSKKLEPRDFGVQQKFMSLELESIQAWLLSCTTLADRFKSNIFYAPMELHIWTTNQMSSR